MARAESPDPGYAPDKQELLRRLRRIEGQVRGVQRMVEDERYCIDVLQQTSAIKGALDQVALRLLDGHVGNCMARGAGDARQRDEMTSELVGAVGRLVRS
jgi:DNA-binding FrmR family transcriptional regulator